MDIQETSPINLKELLETSKKALIAKSQLIRIDEVSTLTTLAKSSINLWVAQSKFPKPIALSATVKVWKLEDVITWIEDQKASK